MELYDKLVLKELFNLPDKIRLPEDDKFILEWRKYQSIKHIAFACNLSRYIVYNFCRNRSLKGPTRLYLWKFT